MVKNKQEYVKRTFEVDKTIYKEFRTDLLKSGVTVKYVINKLLKGYIDGKYRE